LAFFSRFVIKKRIFTFICFALSNITPIFATENALLREQRRNATIRLIINFSIYMKKVFTLLVCSLIASFVAAQTKQINGVVVDEQGLEVIGASVQVKGSTQGTITDFDGKFVLDVDEDAKFLVVKFMGMQDKEVAITGTSLRIVMQEDSKMIEEVVVTGYGNVSKGSFAG
jgi:hypothetical protein